MLNPADRQELVQLLASLPELQTSEGRRQLLNLAQLQALVPLINFDNSTFIAVIAMVDRLESYGEVTAGQQALGMFLTVVSQLLGAADVRAHRIKTLIESYQLLKPALERPLPARPTNADAEGSLEKIIGEDTLRPIAFLERGLEVARSVALVETSQWVGTGFLIAPGLFITNNHVLPNSGILSATRFRFNFQLTYDGKARPPKEFLPVDGGLFHTNPKLDYTLVEVAGQPEVDWGTIPIAVSPPQVGGRVNIIQHPEGLPKKISLQNNLVQYVDANLVQYATSTMRGSSGAPVLDNDWRAVAIHHAGGMQVEPASGRKYFRNEGILLQAILSDLPASMRDRLK